METIMAAGLLVNPIGFLICILIPTITILLARDPQLSASRLAAGYIGALFALAVAVGAWTYVSPQNAFSLWHVAPKQYWGALIELYMAYYVVSAFFSIVSISFVGIPVLVALSNAGRATSPCLIIASVAISTVTAVIAYLIFYSSSSLTFLETLGFFVIGHGVLTVGFCLGARLPWSVGLKSNAN